MKKLELSEWQHYWSICHRYRFTIIYTIAKPLKVIVLFPLIAEVVDEKLRLLVIVPASLLLNTKLGVESLSGVVIAVTEARVGADVSLDVCVQLNCVAAVLFAPDVAPLNAPAATSNRSSTGGRGSKRCRVCHPSGRRSYPTEIRYSSIGNLYV